MPRHARRDTLDSITGHLLWSGPQGVCRTAGAFSSHPTVCDRAPSLRSATWGRKSAGTKGTQGWGPRKPQVSVVADGSRVFGVPLRGRLAVLRCCPSSRASRYDTGYEMRTRSIQKRRSKDGGGRRLPLLPSFGDHGLRFRGGGRGASSGAVCAPPHRDSPSGG